MMINVSDHSDIGLKALFAKREADITAKNLPQTSPNALFTRRKSRRSGASSSAADDRSQREASAHNKLIESLMVINHP